MSIHEQDTIGGNAFDEMQENVRDIFVRSIEYHDILHDPRFASYSLGQLAIDYTILPVTDKNNTKLTQMQTLHITPLPGAEVLFRRQGEHPPEHPDELLQAVRKIHQTPISLNARLDRIQPDAMFFKYTGRRGIGFNTHSVDLTTPRLASSLLAARKILDKLADPNGENHRVLTDGFTVKQYEPDFENGTELD